ncbi:Cell division protein FtsW [Lachnospiraceae bacterium TWA4]|nr:Cell division protein FtsW [Lachnospiraceae bacterium TWA4]
MVIQSASMNTGENTAAKQIMGVALGGICMMVLSLVDYRWLMRNYIAIYVGTLILLALIFVPFIGTDAGTGARRWIRLGIQIQPSEFAKIGMLLFFAMFLQLVQDQVNELPTIGLTAVVFAVPFLLIVKEPDLSSSLVVTFVFLIMLYTAKLSYKWVLSGLAVGILGVLGVFQLLESGILQKLNILRQYQVNRILVFKNPNLQPDLVRQQKNSVMAIGSGQLNGKGLFNTDINSVKNSNFLMEQDTDFIFAVVGEELGFIGSCVIILLLALVVFECILTAIRARDLSGRLICMGMAALITFQSFVNIGVATQILPNTGLPLPFISAGLSSLLSVFIGMGVVFNIGLQRRSEIF